MAAVETATPAPGTRGGTLVSVNLAVVGDVFVTSKHSRGEKPQTTGIDKRPHPGPVRLERLGVAGDTICDTRHHGGLDQAVYAYAIEDLAWWRADLGELLTRPALPGCVGENLTTEGLDVTDSVIGERWLVGGALLEVSVPRIPCRTFAAFWDVPQMIRRFTEAARPGAYLRVVQEGEVTAGDEITVVARPDHGVTIGDTFRAMTGDRSLAADLLRASELPESVHASARQWLAGAAT